MKQRWDVLTVILLLILSVVIYNFAGRDKAKSVREGEVTIAPHKVIYKFKLDSVSPGVALNSVDGEMYFEQDDTCEAWTTDHKLSMKYYYNDQPVVINKSHYVAFENKNRKEFSFSSERKDSDGEEEKLRGSIEQTDKGFNAVYSRPKELKHKLPKDFFLPTSHAMEIIKRAKAGEKLFKSTVFDGTDLEGPVEVSVFIGKKLSYKDVEKRIKKTKKIDKSLLKGNAWSVRLAVFPINRTKDITPAYETDMVIHENGIISSSLIDYKGFKIKQVLTALDKLKVRDCD